MRYLLIFFFFLSKSTVAQQTFVEKCLGGWQGTMYMYNDGIVEDSVPVKLTVAATKDTGVWVWRTEYLSVKSPMVKDYTLKMKDKAKKIYVIDEGGGLLLENYVFSQKMYSLFETQQVYLTATYELIGENLVFEVTSGKKLTATHPEVNNYSIANVQRVVLQKTIISKH